MSDTGNNIHDPVVLLWNRNGGQSVRLTAEAQPQEGNWVQRESDVKIDKVTLFGVLALAFGAFSFGTAEFVVTGLLPYLAHDFEIDIAASGHAITAYAIGVCMGVFYIIFTRNLNLKTSICIIIFTHVIGMAMTAAAPNFGMVLFARFFSGLPHGCFLSLGAIIATRIAKPGQGSAVMALMLAGQTGSIVAGVPLGTALAHTFSFRAIFIFMTVWGVIVLISTLRWLPDPGKMEDRGFWGQFAFLKRRAPYVAALGIALGNGGIFCLQSYVSPILTDFVGVPLVYVSPVLIVMGIAMTVYNLIAGPLADKYTPGKVSLFIFVSAVVTMAVTYAVGNIMILGLVLMIYGVGCLFGVATPQGVVTMHTAPKGELIGFAFGQVAINIGNATGSFLGGVPFDLGFDASAVLIVAGALTLVGSALMYWYVRSDEQEFMGLYKAEQKRRFEEALAHAHAYVSEQKEQGAFDDPHFHQPATAPAAAADGDAAAAAANDAAVAADNNAVAAVATAATPAVTEVSGDEPGTAAQETKSQVKA